MRVLGLMSGTSADGVDAVLMELSGRRRKPKWRVISSAHLPYEQDLRERLVRYGQGAASLTAQEVMELEEEVTRANYRCALLCDKEHTFKLVGCHGQTVWHIPPTLTVNGCSKQLLLGPMLSALLDRPVVYDFRSLDVANGGEGAPLVPLCDEAFFGSRQQRRKWWQFNSRRSSGRVCLLNIGGIANISFLANGEGVRGWDVGPGNTLIDLAAAKLSCGRLEYDDKGSWASEGRACEEAIREWMNEPYFSKRPPKSTGRDSYGALDLERRLSNLASTWSVCDDADIMATLTAFTAEAIASTLKGEDVSDLIVAGGGALNNQLIVELRNRLGPSVTKIQTSAAWGMGIMEREAAAFALLAWWRLHNIPGSHPSVTGTKNGAVRCGVVAYPR